MPSSKLHPSRLEINFARQTGPPWHSASVSQRFNLFLHAAGCHRRDRSAHRRLQTSHRHPQTEGEIEHWRRTLAMRVLLGNDRPEPLRKPWRPCYPAPRPRAPRQPDPRRRRSRQGRNRPQTTIADQNQDHREAPPAASPDSGMDGNTTEPDPPSRTRLSGPRSSDDGHIGTLLCTAQAFRTSHEDLDAAHAVTEADVVSLAGAGRARGTPGWAIRPGDRSRRGDDPGRVVECQAKTGPGTPVPPSVSSVFVLANDTTRATGEPGRTGQDLLVWRRSSTINAPTMITRGPDSSRSLSGQFP